MFKEGTGVNKIVIACGRTDLRRGIDQLKAQVQLQYGRDPLEEGTLFLFCGKKPDRIKGLIFEGSGYCLFTYRVLNGRFQWPRNSDDARDISLDQFRLLMSGFTIEGSIRPYRKEAE